MNGIKQLLCVMSIGIPICWKTYETEEEPSEKETFLISGFFSAITSFSQILAKGGRLECLVISGRTFYVRQNSNIICVFESNYSRIVDEVWDKISEQHQELLKNIPKFERLLQTMQEYRDDFGLLVDTILTSIKGQVQLIPSRSWLSRLRR